MESLTAHLPRVEGATRPLLKGDLSISRKIRLESLIEVKPFQPKVPLYNPMIHRAGDTVMVRQGKRLIEVKIPLLDADGQAVYES